MINDDVYTEHGIYSYFYSQMQCQSFLWYLKFYWLSSTFTMLYVFGDNDSRSYSMCINNAAKALHYKIVVVDYYWELVLHLWLVGEYSTLVLDFNGYALGQNTTQPTTKPQTRTSNKSVCVRVCVFI